VTPPDHKDPKAVAGLSQRLKGKEAPEYVGRVRKGRRGVTEVEVQAAVENVRRVCPYLTEGLPLASICWAAIEGAAAAELKRDAGGAK
jgi:hypothetical protein